MTEPLLHKSRIDSVLEIYEKVVPWLIVLVTVLVVVAWLMILDFSARGHREIVIAEELQKSCDHEYIEGSAPRAKVFNFLTTEETVDRRNRLQLLNRIVQLVLTTYIVFIVFSILPIFNLVKVNLLANKSEKERLWTTGIFFALSLGLVAWLITNASAQYWFKFLPNNDSNSMQVHAWTFITVAVVFAWAYQMRSSDDGVPIIALLFSMCAISASILAACAYFCPKMYNKAVNKYKDVQDVFKTAYTGLTPVESNLVCGAARHNMLMETGKTFPAEQCETKGSNVILEYTEHQKGQEFMQEDNAGVTDSMKALRESLSKVRKQNDGVEALRKFTLSILLVSALVFVIGLFAVMNKFFMQFDNIILDNSGTSWVLLSLFMLIIIGVSFAWIKNALVNTNSDISGKKEN